MSNFQTWAARGLLALSLSPDEQELEREFRRTSNGRTANRKQQKED